MSESLLKLVVGTNNRHKLREIRQILGDLAGVELIALSAYTGVPPIEETANTFRGNAELKAYGLARFISLAGRVSYASRSISIDGDTDFEAISARRARTASGRHLPVKVVAAPRVDPPVRLDLLVMADDSGLEVDALKGKPGVNSARYCGRHGDNEANNRLLLKNLKGVPREKRKARFVCEIALANPDGILFSTRGTVAGLIAAKPVGTMGFGYDPLFYYPPEKKSFGQLAAKTKNGLSHRYHALLKFRTKLEKLLANR